MEEIKELLHDRILVDPETLENTTKSGIILSVEVNREKQGFGRVLLIAKEVGNVKVGDKVVYPRMAGFELNYQDKPVKMLRSTDISAIIEEDK